MKNLDDIIVAIATPPGVAAIGIIRLSGPGCIELVSSFFEGKDLTKVKGHTAHYGKLKNQDNELIDECVATVFRSPRSYTKEDIVELSCHGSPYILDRVLGLFLNEGARMAEAGEFTLRAFLNGQLDLSQAEAVADLIASSSRASHQLALNHMRGSFSNEIQELRQQLIDFAALIELELDFGEEDVEFADKEKLFSLVEKIRLVLQRLISSFHLGNVLKNGVTTVIAGRPNAGKSTLLNALLNEERAIVSDVAGTTRDTIEELLNIKGILFRLIDTAGIRKAQNEIEKLGVSRTMEKIAQSTLVIYVFDISALTPEEVWTDIEMFLEGSKALTQGSHRIFVANKIDLRSELSKESYYKKGLISENDLLTVSASKGIHIDELTDKIYNTVIENPELMDQTIVSNTRHYSALKKADKALSDVENSLRSGITGDFIAMDLRQALHYLGEITGEIYTDDLLDSIFSRFCIGK